MQHWLIIDANILFNAIRYTKTPQGQIQRDPAYTVIEFYLNNHFVWVYSEEILEEYITQYVKLKREASASKDKRSFDQALFNQVIASVKEIGVLVEPTEEQDDQAYEVMMDKAREQHLRDPNDAMYLAAAACAKEHQAQISMIIASDDSDLYTLGAYQEIPIYCTDDLIVDGRLSLD